MAQVDPEKSNPSLIQPDQKKLILILSTALLIIIAVIVLVEMDFSGAPVTEISHTEQKTEQKAPEAVLKAVVTDCDMLTTSLDDTGSSQGYGDYRRIAGYVENRGDVTVNFVRVKIIWRDKDDRIIQVDEVFATGDTPLHPGERADFEDSKKNYLIQKCGAKVLDWWTISAEDAEKQE